jgi:hypothetical protein
MARLHGLDPAVTAVAQVAVSRAGPTRPIDWTIPSLRQLSLNVAEVYSLPRSLWKITPSTLPPRVATPCVASP